MALASVSPTVSLEAREGGPQGHLSPVLGSQQTETCFFWASRPSGSFLAGAEYGRSSRAGRGAPWGPAARSERGLRGEVHLQPTQQEGMAVRFPTPAPTWAPGPCLRQPVPSPRASSPNLTLYLPPAILPFIVGPRFCSPPPFLPPSWGSVLPTQVLDADAPLGSHSFGRVESK